MRLGAGHLLFQDRRDERIQDGFGPGQSDAPVASRQPGDRGGRRIGELGHVAAVGPDAEQAVRPLDDRRRAGTPAGDLQVAIDGPHLERRRSVGRSGGPPGPGRREPDRPVTRSAHERRERPDQVQRAVHAQLPLRIPISHVRSLSRNRHRPGPRRQPSPGSSTVASVIPLVTTCDAPGSSRAWRSSPSSPRSPSQDRWVRGP